MTAPALSEIQPPEVARNEAVLVMVAAAERTAKDRLETVDAIRAKGVPGAHLATLTLDEVMAAAVQALSGREDILRGLLGEWIDTDPGETFKAVFGNGSDDEETTDA